MKFEGKQINIPIKGIMRAGTDYLAADGAMNEVIGMEYKDGSWLPYKTKIENKNIVVYTNGNWVGVGGICKAYVHKTSDGNKHYIFQTSTGGVYYEFNQEDNFIETKILSTSVNDVAVVGNILCLSTETGLEFYLWDALEGEYSTYQPKDLYGSLPRLNFRVTSFDENTQMTSNNTEGSVLYTRGSNLSAAHAIVEADGWQALEHSSYKSAVSELAMKASYLAQEKGRFYGAFLVCYAYRLRSGNYIAASPPLLMNVPSVVNGGGDTEHPVYLPKSALYIGTNSFQFNPGINGAASWNDEFTPLVDEIDDSENGIVCLEEGIWHNGEPGEHTYDTTFINSFTDMPALFGYYHDRHSAEQDSFLVAGCVSNLLQFKIASDIPDEYKHLIDSVCVFVSEQVSGYKTFSALNTTCTGGRRLTRGADDFTASYRFERKSASELREDILKLKNFYCVYEVPFARIKQSTDWETPNLEGRLGDSLLTMDSLPLTAMKKDDIITGEFFTYNRRLHIFNYTESKCLGHNTLDFNYFGGKGQYSGSGLIHYPMYIKTTIESEEGTTEVWKYALNGPDYFNPVISYPSEFATEMDIYLYNPTFSNWRHKHLDLEPSPSRGFSMYIADDLEPVHVGTDDIGDLPEHTNKNNKITYPNRMRVSDSAFSSYFPLANTYSIGNERIIRLASLAISIMFDTFGKFPILALCKDGIYSLEVDSSGNGTYKTVTPFSREVVVNKKSVCEIDGTVIFASDKGLMVATQKGVEEFSPHINGPIRFMPDYNSTSIKSGKAIFGKIVTSGDIVTLNESLDSVDFIDYLHKTDTVVSYISKKHKLVVYNKTLPYVYLIDVSTRNATKLKMKIEWDDDNFPEETYWISGYNTDEYTIRTFTYRSREDNVDCLVQSRPIVVQQDDKSSCRVVISGYFNNTDTVTDNHWAYIVVLSSLDGENWRVIGVKGKKLSGGFHNMGCLTERDSWKYLMVIFAGNLSTDSHIDSLDITVNGRYNNKKR